VEPSVLSDVTELMSCIEFQCNSTGAFIIAPSFFMCLKADVLPDNLYYNIVEFLIVFIFIVSSVILTVFLSTWFTKFLKDSGSKQFIRVYI
jgi:hypothetical protein